MLWWNSWIFFLNFCYLIANACPHLLLKKYQPVVFSIFYQICLSILYHWYFSSFSVYSVFSLLYPSLLPLVLRSCFPWSYLFYPWTFFLLRSFLHQFSNSFLSFIFFNFCSGNYCKIVFECLLWSFAVSELLSGFWMTLGPPLQT